MQPSVRPARRIPLLFLVLSLVGAPTVLRAAPLPDDKLVDAGSAKLQAGNVQAALADFAAAEKLAPKDPRPRYLRGAALAKVKDAMGAIKAYREALALDGKLANVHNELGALLDEGGHTEEAFAEFKAALAADASLGEAWQNLGKLESGRKKYDAAIEALRKAAKLMDKDADVRVDLAMALRSAGKKDEAVAAAREAVSLDGACAPAHMALGFSLQSSGKLDGAAAEFLTATKLTPDDAGAHWALGLVERDRKKDAAALAALTRAYQLRPSVAIAVDLAHAQGAVGERTRAVDTLRAASAKAPRSLALRIELGAALAEDKKCAEARKELASLPAQPAVEAAVARAAKACGKDWKN